MAYELKRTDIIVRYDGYQRVDRYRTIPKGVGNAPYLALKTIRGSTTGSSSYITSQFNTASSWVQARSASGSEPLAGLLNKAYADLKESVYESMQIASNVVEGRETLKMVRDRSRKTGVGAVRTVQNAVADIERGARRLSTAYLQLKRGAFSSFLRTLGLKAEKGRLAYLRKRRKKARRVKREANDVANTWLEYHLGWSPTVQDIFNAYDTLTGEIGEGKHVGRAAHKESSVTKPLDYWIASVQGRLSVKMGARFTLVNPNAFLREQAGLSNPASWLWEALPFSFLVDWIFNMSQCLSAMTDFTGLRYDDPYVTVFALAKSRDTLTSPASPIDTEFTAMQIRRTLGMHRPDLRLSLPKRLSVSRAATSVALLLQVFNK